MPSAKVEKQMSTETYDPMKQIVTIVEKKVRNLEKRKGKLDAYRLDSQNGKELNEDQKKAVEKYDLVVELLDFAKDLQKQFQTVVLETTRAQKKAAKRDQVERQQLEVQRIREIMLYQDLLSSMGGEDVRQDFLEGNKGAIKLTEKELDSIDELYKVLCPERETEATNSPDFESMLSASAEHIQALLDAKNKEAFGTTYKSLRETLQKINSCSYFAKSTEIEEVEESAASLPEEQEEFAEEPAEPIAAVEDYAITPKSEDFTPAPQVEHPYYSVENPAIYATEPVPQPPIQEVLSSTNFNFLQESQIEVAASHQEPTAALPQVSYTSVPYPPAGQPSHPTHHLTRRPSEEAIPNHSAPPNLMANQASIQPTPAQSADYNQGRPIPTQTYTNQTFHPMMVQPQNYVAPPHAMPPAQVLAPSMVVQPLPPRNVVTQANVAMPLAHASVSGLSVASPVTQQANIYSLCLKMNQLNSENSQSAHVQNLQYNAADIQEMSQAGTYGNGGSSHVTAPENQTRGGNNAYARTAALVDYGNDRAPYQSSNNNQAYLPRENFGDNSSYSSNLKRGLTSRGGPRGGSSMRGGNMPRGNRVGNRY